MLSFPYSQVRQFQSQDRIPCLRVGQAFHNFMKLEKCGSDKEFCDKLYELDGQAAMDAIMSRVDYAN